MQQSVIRRGGQQDIHAIRRHQHKK